MFNNFWFRKEKPFLGLIGLGGGVGSNLVAGAFNYVEATGGLLMDYESPSSPGTYYRAHVFTSSGTFAVSAGGEVEYIVVGGGGGGNAEYQGAAGGAGGYLTDSGTPVSVGSYTITVGGGGAASVADNVPALPGNTSSFGTPITAYGGAGGGGKKSAADNGGSGAGGSTPSQGNAAGSYGLNPSTPAPIIATFPLYTPGTTQGYPGGANPGSAPTLGGGGGGGAGGAGQGGSSPQVGGAGGIGVQAPATFRNPNNYMGAPGPGGGYFWFAGGGGGGFEPGGTGGGGGGGTVPAPYAGGGPGGNDPDGVGPTRGLTNTGGGAGAYNHPGAGTFAVGLSEGGSGLVAIVYELESSVSTAKATGGIISFIHPSSPSPMAGQTIHTFISSGDFHCSQPGTPATYLVVAGGGAGGCSNGTGDGVAGGGAGGVVSNHPDAPTPTRQGALTLPTSPHTITIGAGGAVARFNPSVPGNSERLAGGYGNYSDVPFIAGPGMVAGGGAGNTGNNSGLDGASGGGATGPGSGGGGPGVAGSGNMTSPDMPGHPAPTSGYYLLGFPGGANPTNWGSGGGGGYLGAGQDSQPWPGSWTGGTGGNGGAGCNFTISGTSTGYGGGGGGGAAGPPRSPTVPAGTGTHGGGSGAPGHPPGGPVIQVNTGGHGTAHSGGGGGGGSGAVGPLPGAEAPLTMGGKGGSGVVIIAYPT